jgi:DNA-binding LytR/AlgR family response regulator
MRVVIVEDESLAARRLRSMIESYDPTIEVVASLESVKSSIEWFSSHAHPDLIFLDIHLEDDLSFSIFEKVRISSSIIFTTAFDEYAIKAFKLKSIDYLLKPITTEDLHAALQKYAEMNVSQPVKLDLHALYGMIAAQTKTFRTRFSAQVGQKIKTFHISDVAYFFSEEGFTSARLFDGNQYFIDSSLDALTPELDPSQFYRINRKLLLSLGSIKETHLYPKGRLKLNLQPHYDSEVLVSIDKGPEFKKWLGANK